MIDDRDRDFDFVNRKNDFEGSVLEELVVILKHIRNNQKDTNVLLGRIASSLERNERL